MPAVPVYVETLDVILRETDSGTNQEPGRALVGAFDVGENVAVVRLPSSCIPGRSTKISSRSYLRRAARSRTWVRLALERRSHSGFSVPPVGSP